jgi:octaprenyl-diphosphate synthase
VTGKPSGLDLREHKVTLPLIAALPRLSEAGRRDVAQLMRTEQPGAEQVARIVQLVTDAGGLEYARERAQQFAQSADAELDRLPSSPAREALRASITYVLERRS